MGTSDLIRSVRFPAALAAATLSLGVACFTHAARAQAAEPEASKDAQGAEADDSADAAKGDEADGDSGTRSGAEKEAATPVPTEQDGTTRAAVLGAEGVPAPERLSWPGGFIYGGLELDLGYAKYEYPELVLSPEETVHDLRGRFVLGAMLDHPFGNSGYFLRATGQMVGWVREKEQRYQINVDDVYGAFGKRDLWDIQVGRFMTWRVYHKGLGYDLYTLEDAGASEAPPISNGRFVVHTYEADYIYLRNSPYVGGEVAGRAALHVFPTEYLGFELTGAYGLAQAEASNTLGGRLAADLNLGFLRVTAAGEYRQQRLTAPRLEAGPTGANVECTNCGDSDNKGIGGGAIAHLGPVEVGGGVAHGWDRSFNISGGGTGKAPEVPAGSGTRFSYGGYLQLDFGSLFWRPLIAGFGMHKTEWILKNFNSQYHDQYAAYLAFPLGVQTAPGARFASTGSVNDAMIKLVVSRSDAEIYDAIDVGGDQYISRNRGMWAARFRLVYGF